MQIKSIWVILNLWYWSNPDIKEKKKEENDENEENNESKKMGGNEYGGSYGSLRIGRMQLGF